MSSNPSILVYGMGTKAVEPSGTIGAAWKAHADELGGERDRAILVRANGESIDPSSSLEPGTTYSISVALGDKGAR